MVHAETNQTTETENSSGSRMLQRTAYATFDSGQWVDAKQMPKLSDGWNGYFYIEGAISWGFCAQNTTPGWYNNQVKGGYIVEWNDATVRKILYYAPGSPGYTGTNIAYDMDNATYATGYMNGDSNNNTRAQTYIASLAGLTDPIVYGYKAYYMYNSETNYQDVAFLGLAPQGALEIVKYSSNSNLTNNNSNYSLAGAVYGVYAQDGEYSTPEYTITLSEWDDGWSGLAQGVKYGWGKIEGLPPGNYWIKEITAPKGFELDPNWYPSYSTPITVSSGNTARITTYDEPQLGSLEIYKSSTNPELTTDNEYYSLKDAVYGVYFADGNYTTPEYTITTDKNGYGVVKDIPIGEYWIKEITPPKGFELDENWYPSYDKSIYVGDNATATIYVEDEPELIEIEILKKQENSEVVIPNTAFEHKSPNGTTDILYTDKNGRILLDSVQYGIHEIREISVMEGYLLNENVVVLSVKPGNQIEVLGELDDSKGKLEWRITESGNVELEIYDKVVPFQLVICKSNNTGEALEGAEFTIYLEESCNNMFAQGVTDADGKIEFTGLTVETKYYLKETKAPMGYRIPTDENGNPTVRELELVNIPAKGEIRFYLDGVECEFGTGNEVSLIETDTEPKVEMSVVNEVGFRLPQTGSSQEIILCYATAFCYFMSIRTKNKRKEEK